MAEKMWGHSPCGIYGYSHLTGGYAGGQAQYVRVPYADVNHLKIENGLTDEQALFLTDILPTGYFGAENCNIQRGDTVAVWGCGPVGQFAIASARLLGAERVIAIDRIPARLAMAREECGAEAVNYEEVDLSEYLKEVTGGRGPDACVDAVGMEGHLPGIAGVYDRVKQAAMMQSDRPPALRQAIMSVRNGGTVSVIGVYGGLLSKMPFGAVVNRGLTIKAGQTPVHRYLRPLLERIERGEIDPTFVITHRITLDEVPQAFQAFNDKEDDVLKIVVKP
jgi:threonine dehydrogenase-like Zn-dependent dehydrogenase